MMLDYFKGKSVFVTGHTGFKGAWLTRILQLAEAKVTGYALAPIDESVYEQIVENDRVDSLIADIRDYDKLSACFEKSKPEIVFHLAAQPLVLNAFEEPAYTFDVNVQGTVNLLECVRFTPTVKSVIIITTDKVYKNEEWLYGYRENDALGDTEPYAASKACAEIVSKAYYETFLKSNDIALSTVRAGNVIGGGDASANRIVPDCVRSARNNEPIIIRNPYSVRPYQHVLESLFAYLMIAEKQSENCMFAGQYNVGPNESDCITTAELSDIFCAEWGNGQMWSNTSNSKSPHESGLLKLDCSKIRSVFNWRPMWDVRTAVKKTIEWEMASDKSHATELQIKEYCEDTPREEKFGKNNRIRRRQLW